MSEEIPHFGETGAGDGSAHLSMDEIADLGEGLLAADRVAAARAHLQACDECSGRAAALNAAGEALRGLGPVQMPSDVAARLDAAFAAEATAPTPGTADSSSTVIPDLGEVRQRRFGRPTMAASAAAVVLILAVTAILVGHTNHHHDLTAERSAAGQGVAPIVGLPPTSSTLTPLSTGRTYTPANLAAYVPALVDETGPSPAATSSGGPATGGGGAGAAATGTGTLTPTRKSAKNHHHRRHGDALASNGGPAAVAAPQTAAPKFVTNARVPSALARFQNSPSAILQCAAAITTTPGATPEAVDFARWSNPGAATPTKNLPVLIMVFADPHSLSSIDVYVVAASCDENSLITFQKVPLPS